MIWLGIIILLIVAALGAPLFACIARRHSTYERVVEMPDQDTATAAEAGTFDRRFSFHR